MTAAAALVLLLGCLNAGAQTSMSEYQVKALFLLKFIKYVDWPVDKTGPMIIGIWGEDRVSDNLKRTVAGKTINGRSILIRNISTDDEMGACSILFISSSENARLGEILGRTGALPILTVGETDSFLQKGGIINFTLKEGKIHLEINLKAAQKAKLQISSKLLSVADTVKE